MKKLHHILKEVELVRFMGDAEILIKGITADSRAVEPGFLFVAVRGTQHDGHHFIDMAIQAGAAAVVLEYVPSGLDSLATYVEVKNAAQALGLLSSAFYDHPSRRLQLVGITGTNGKTTTATLSYELFRALGYGVGLISTIENKIDGTVIPSTHTTPDPVQLNQLLASMVTAGCTYAFMEVSSHAAHQQRIAGLHFTVAVFTNITHDHLDYHKTFDKYIAAKKMFFDGLSADAHALINNDDVHSSVMVQNTNAEVHTYGVKSDGDFTTRIINNSIDGLQLRIDGNELHTPMRGAFNAWNLTAVYGTAILLRQDKDAVLTAISGLGKVPGRLEVVQLSPGGITGVVDYAHTPDAVEQVLTTLRDMLVPGKHIVTVIGCGGNRDKAKRPVMAKTAAKYSDKVVLTSDNPRDEEPEMIIREMEEGLSAEMKHKTLSIVNRKEAIRTAIHMAAKGDVVLVAGKGHELYQEIKGVKYPFNDKEIITETLKNITG
ncbi:MAG: UDP-N-acetylmuramoylalanyl-D-glutamate--2,6-diaminopimelate ligase [Sphingobacteriales bacterium BACL12 MAG-120813-bin55]|jgi:UDP-N-acetylmuramoyl-L-alanyl-D-glutamate--2,6-diaminopimelate ligase|nr:MAG: UDP-N-acetylmuramoylalanyl-D-glutamate--2,6-diaminopimelate ligase [Sphingobacteriales bacterium BACL12 MAG-120802-bin5]KRP11693.1 MAG: UDP-N-acetylmuramoylalanyl-D-glutamate--2,6-diaminopimelate ligase [Sphingobacteriales bacterium BACL12 MAG-120813-bin55]